MTPERPVFKVYVGSWTQADQYSTTGGTGGADFDGFMPNWTLHTDLQPTMISLTSNGEIGECRLEYLANGDYADSDSENFSPVRDNLPVRIVACFYHNGTMAETQIVFQGVMVKYMDEQGGDAYHKEFICYNLADDFFRRKIAYGQYWLTYPDYQFYYENGSTLAGSDYGDIELPVINDYLFTQKPLIFNPQGAYNCLNQLFLEGKGRHQWFFDKEDRRDGNANGGSFAESPQDYIYSIPWTLRRALVYLRDYADWAISSGWEDINLQTVFGAYQVFDADGKTINAETVQTDPVLYNLNLNGRSLATCLRELLEPFGYGYSIAPNNEGSNKGHKITFFRRSALIGTGYAAVNVGREMVMDGDTPNVLKYNITEDSTPVVNYLTFLGNQQVITCLASNEQLSVHVPDSDPDINGLTKGILPLVPGFAISDLNNLTYDDTGEEIIENEFTTNISTSNGGDQIFAAGRMWIVNTGENFEQQIYDLNVLFTDLDDPPSAIGAPEEPDVWSTSRFVYDRKKLDPPQYYTVGSSSKEYTQMPLVVEASVDGGENWFIVNSGKYQVLHDRMGIVFTETNLSDFAGEAQLPAGVSLPTTSYWTALTQDKLKLRILCSFKSDQRIGWAITPTGPGGETGVAHLMTEALSENLAYNRYYESNGLRSQSSVGFVYQDPEVNVVDDVKKLTGASSTIIQSNYLPTYSGQIVMGVRLDKSVGFLHEVYTLFNEVHPGQVVPSITDRRDFSINPPLIIRTVLDCLNWQYQIYVTTDNQLSPLNNGGKDTFNNVAMKYANKVSREQDGI